MTWTYTAAAVLYLFVGRFIAGAYFADSGNRRGAFVLWLFWLPMLLVAVILAPTRAFRR